MLRSATASRALRRATVGASPANTRAFTASAISAAVGPSKTVPSGTRKQTTSAAPAAARQTPSPSYNQEKGKNVQPLVAPRKTVMDESYVFPLVTRLNVQSVFYPPIYFRRAKMHGSYTPECIQYTHNTLLTI